MVSAVESDMPTIPTPKCSDHPAAEREAFNLDQIQADNTRAARLYEELRDVE